AASLLNKGGVIVLSFWSEKAFITDRMATVLAEVFEHKPLTFVLPTSAYGWGGMQFVTGDRATIEGQLAADGRLRELIDEWQKAVPITFAGTTKTSTDDWPYLYLEHPRVPVLYFLLGVLLVVLFVRGLRKLEGPAIVRGWTQQSWHFFFL